VEGEVLVGASGGGSSQFAGTYTGPAEVTVSGGGVTDSGLATYIIQVSSSGQVTGLFPGQRGEQNCSSAPSPQVQSNGSFSSSANQTCDDPVFAGRTCSVSTTVNGTIAGNEMLATVNTTYNCGNITINTRIQFNGNR